MFTLQNCLWSMILFLTVFFATSNAKKYTVVANIGATLQDCKVVKKQWFGYRSAQLAECVDLESLCVSGQSQNQ